MSIPEEAMNSKPAAKIYSNHMLVESTLSHGVTSNYQSLAVIKVLEMRAKFSHAYYPAPAIR